MSEKQILFTDFMPVDFPSKTKIKFNMNSGDRSITALDNLLNNEDDAKDDEWIRMNAWRLKKSSNDLDKVDYLISFAQYGSYGPEYYIFGGYYKVEKISPAIDGGVGYKLTLLDKYKEYRKRLIIKLRKPIGRDLYTRWYENVQSQLDPQIYELMPFTKLRSFPGYGNVFLTHKELQMIYRLEEPEWMKALSYVKGVYCITDTLTGQLYIGSAYGDSMGIWQRWKNYADIDNLSGGNKTFEYMKKQGADRIIDNFTYSILEIFDMKTMDNIIINREEYWKKVLKTKEFGMNN